MPRPNLAFILSLWLLTCSIANVPAVQETGDVNDDTLINVVDVTALGQAIEQGELPPLSVGDVNEDGVVSEADVTLLARWIVDGIPDSPDPEELTITLPGDIPLVLVRIPAGTFVMGSPSGERGRSTNEGPQTNVTITQPFYMGKYEVTQAQWLALMESNPSFFKAPNLPVETLSWDEANEFITALNDHITSTGQGPAMVRLPTEAEWEYAARAGTTTRFHFGDSLSVDDACTDDDIRSQYMWFCGSAENLTHPVGQLLPNAFGLHDMNGNAWEWCQDWIDLYPGGSVNDPQGPATGTARVYRGGSLGSSAGLCRSAYRNGGQPANRFFFIGLRLVAVP